MGKITRTITETKVKYKLYNRETGLMEEVENSYLGNLTREKAISRVAKDYKGNTNYIFIDVLTVEPKETKYAMNSDEFIKNSEVLE